ncbi:MAG: DUF4886 domain-containing protein [Bacteroidota bacterium]
MRLFVLAFGLILGSLSGVFGQDEATPNVLFVGNSYTYFWNLPQTVAVMAAEKDVPLQTRQSTSGGVNLGQHWRGERELNTQALIRSGEFDVVIIQDHSRRAVDHPDSLQYYGNLLAELCRESGATPYVYMTWAREWDPYMQAPITEQYKLLGERIDVEVIPVGLAWQRARTLRPSLSLFDPDGSHPSPTGTYLIACVVFGALTGESPVGLPHRIVSTDKDGEKLYLNIQSKEDALFCQKVAQEMLTAAALLSDTPMKN